MVHAMKAIRDDLKCREEKRSSEALAVEESLK